MKVSTNPTRVAVRHALAAAFPKADSANSARIELLAKCLAGITAGTIVTVLKDFRPITIKKTPLATTVTVTAADLSAIATYKQGKAGQFKALNNGRANLAQAIAKALAHIPGLPAGVEVKIQAIPNNKRPKALLVTGYKRRQ
jgi:hypothetical protein